MTTPYSETHGVRQLAVLATVAACIALMTLLIGAVMSGLASLHYGVALVLASLAFVGVALFGGWVPGLYLGLLTLVVGAIVAGDEFSWVQAVVLAITISGVHEASRFSLDARKPTRLGAGLLIRTSLSSLAGTGVAIVAGVIIRPALTDDPCGLLDPLSLGGHCTAALRCPFPRVRHAAFEQRRRPNGQTHRPGGLRARRRRHRRRGGDGRPAPRPRVATDRRANPPRMWPRPISARNPLPSGSRAALRPCSACCWRPPSSACSMEHSTAAS